MLWKDFKKIIEKGLTEEEINNLVIQYWDGQISYYIEKVEVSKESTKKIVLFKLHVDK